MAKRKLLTNKAGEVRELMTQDLKHFRPASEVQSPSLRKKLATRARSPQKAPTKERIPAVARDRGTVPRDR